MIVCIDNQLKEKYTSVKPRTVLAITNNRKWEWILVAPLENERDRLTNGGMISIIT